MNPIAIEKEICKNNAVTVEEEVSLTNKQEEAETHLFVLQSC